MQRIILGVKSMTLTDAVDTFLSLQENVNRNHFLRYLTSAKWVMKDLLKDTIWAVKKSVHTVDGNGTIKLHGDVERLLGISVVDECGNIQPLYYNEDINTLTVASHKQSVYSCPNCGGTDGTLCCVFDNITYVEEVQTLAISDVNNGDSAEYLVKTYIIKDEFGNVSKEIEIYGPIVSMPSGDPYPLVKKYTEKVCELEVSDCGCVTNTIENVEKVNKHLCCHMPMRCERPSPTNHFGHFKEDGSDNRILHIYGKKITQVVATYQSSCEVKEGGEIMVPEYAFAAFSNGMNFWANQFVTTVSVGEKRENRRIYYLEKKKLLIHMNPISLEQFAAMAGTYIKWG